jgi:hypothetical protein
MAKAGTAGTTTPAAAISPGTASSLVLLLRWRLLHGVVETQTLPRIESRTTSNADAKNRREPRQSADLARVAMTG